MFLTIKLKRAQKIPAVLLFLAVCVTMVLAAEKLLLTAPVSGESSGVSLVIDPGHGGVDGGAISMGGDKESSINLSIGLRLQQLAELYGTETVMTRDTDSGADQSGESYSEHRELVARTEIINSVPNGVLISIHQNFYPTPGPSGAQVLYAAGEGSESFGRLTHGLLVSHLDPKNRRVATPAPKSLYITSHVSCPAILVECGFMSNFAEVERLRNADYQMSIAAVLLASYLQFSSGQART